MAVVTCHMRRSSPWQLTTWQLSQAFFTQACPAQIQPMSIVPIEGTAIGETTDDDYAGQYQWEWQQAPTKAAKNKNGITGWSGNTIRQATTSTTIFNKQTLDGQCQPHPLVLPHPFKGAAPRITLPVDGPASRTGRTATAERIPRLRSQSSAAWDS